MPTHTAARHQGERSLVEAIRRRDRAVLTLRLADGWRTHSAEFVAGDQTAGLIGVMIRRRDDILVGTAACHEIVDSPIAQRRVADHAARTRHLDSVKEVAAGGIGPDVVPAGFGLYSTFGGLAWWYCRAQSNRVEPFRGTDESFVPDGRWVLEGAVRNCCLSGGRSDTGRGYLGIPSE